MEIRQLYDNVISDHSNVSVALIDLQRQFLYRGQ